MPVTYKVIIAKVDKNLFKVTWINEEAKTETNFEQSSANITAREVKRLWEQPDEEQQKIIGEKLFNFLDGGSHYFQRALDNVPHGESLHVYLCPCKETADWPFELLVRDRSFLLSHRVHLTRTLPDWEIKAVIPPKNRPLKLLFMACSAMDVHPVLDFEKEEETIFKVTETLAVNMDVEDTGSLEGLREQLRNQQYDVVHLSGHADIDKDGNPYFIMEDEIGGRRDVSCGDLWHQALKENPPRLLFLSGCRTGETPDSGAEVSFARMMVEKFHIPAVLGWGRSVSDIQAILAEEILYRELSRGRTVFEALMQSRSELKNRFKSSPQPAWHLLRLFSGGRTLGAIVSEDSCKQPAQRLRRMVHTYLEKSRVKILSEGFVGRRRQLQQSLRVLKYEKEKVGLLLHGTGGLGKSCLAGKVCERFPRHSLIVVHGVLNSITLQNALHHAFETTGDVEGKEILAEKKEMIEKLEALCTSSFKNKNYLLILDDFEQNIEGYTEGEPGDLRLETTVLLKVLLYYLPFSGKMSQVLITCRYFFSLTEQGEDLVKKRLEPVALTSLQYAEQKKKARELKNILKYPHREMVSYLVAAGYGNPRLMEWLDVLVGEMAEAEVPELLSAMRDKKEDFIRHHVIRELLHRGGVGLEEFLQSFSIYRLPVLERGAVYTGENVGFKEKECRELLERSLELSLVEHDMARQTFQVTPLLREELLTCLGEGEDETCHRAAFNYYKEVCDILLKADKFHAALAEEWIYHALTCGEEEVASRQGGRLVKYLHNNLHFPESLRVGEWVLVQKKQRLANEHDAFLLNELGGAVDNMGDKRKALKYYQQALEIYREIYGENHQNIADLMNNLGSIWDDLGDKNQAIEHYEKALKIDRIVVGNEHPNIAVRLNNLGEAFRTLGKPNKAIEYYEQALKIWRGVYGENHTNVVTALTNLGLAWDMLGNKHLAIEYIEQGLKIDQAVFGNKHPKIAIRLNNLGEIFRSLGDPQKAIEYHEQALHINWAIFGNEHLNVAGDLNNLGSAWRALGDFNKAIKYYAQALKIWEEAYGENHPQVATGFNHIGLAWYDLGKNHRAIEFYEKALEIWKEVYDETHPDVAVSLNNIGEAFRALGEPDKAIEYLEQALKIWRGIYGENHTNIAVTLNNLGEAFRALGKSNKAIEYYEQALKIDRACFGTEHPAIAREFNNLGTAYFQLGQKEKAKDYFQKAYAIFYKTFGPQHPNTKIVAESIYFCNKN